MVLFFFSKCGRCSKKKTTKRQTFPPISVIESNPLSREHKMKRNKWTVIWTEAGDASSAISVALFYQEAEMISGFCLHGPGKKMGCKWMSLIVMEAYDIFDRDVTLLISRVILSLDFSLSGNWMCLSSNQCDRAIFFLKHYMLGSSSLFSEEQNIPQSMRDCL